MKIKEIIERVQALYSKGAPSDDSRLTNRLVYSAALSARSLLVSQQIKKKQQPSDWNYQRVPCVEFITVAANACPCVIETSCEILRSKYRLPSIVMGYTQYAIKAITSSDRKVKVDLIPMNAVNAQKGNKYTSKKVNCFIDDGYLYLISTLQVKTLAFSALFEDPIEAHKFIGYCNETSSCLDILDLEFPIDSSMIEALIEIVSKELLETFLKVPADLTNDSKDRI